MLRILLTTFSISLFSVSALSDNSCENKEDYKETIQCLNQYAAEKIKSGSLASKYFYQRFERLTNKYGLTPKDVKHTAMDKHFKIVVEDRPPIGSEYTEKCFDFSRWNPKRHIKNLKKQIDEVAMFTAEIHARAWGNQVSLLFPIKEISLCSAKANKGRDSSFSQRSISLSVDLNDVQKADEMLLRWDEGNPVRKHDMGFSQYVPFGGYFRYLWNGRDKESALRDKVADYWPVLNPIGKVRTTALYTLVSAAKKLKNRVQDEGITIGANSVDEMKNVIQEKGFTQKDRERFQAILKDEDTSKKLYKLWQMKQSDPKNMLQVIEEGIGHNARRSKKLHIVMRDIKALVSVTNDKTITVRLMNLIKNSLPVMNFVDNEQNGKDRMELTSEEESLEIQGDFTDTVVNKSKVRSLVHIDLIDDVLVSIQVPNISALAYRRITLYQALHEIVVPGEHLGPL